MEAFINALQYIRNNDGELPPNFVSIQDRNGIGESGVSDEIVQIMRKEAVEQRLVDGQNTETVLCLVDGFLLYSDPGVVRELDIRFLVRAPYEKLKARREARSGYATIEGTRPIAIGSNIQDSGKIRLNTLTKLSGRHMLKITAIFSTMGTSTAP